jgi:hypothetical protein
VVGPEGAMEWGSVVGAVLAITLFACDQLPLAPGGTRPLVMEVANQSGRPVPLVVATPGRTSDVVGVAQPALIPPGQTLQVRFFVPVSEAWAIYANGGELIGSIDAPERLAPGSYGIQIGPDGGAGWWAEGLRAHASALPIR